MTAVIPEVIEQPTLAQVLEVVTRAVFQAGMSWAQIAHHWDAYRTAFDAFDVARVAEYDDIDIERALGQPGVMRQPRKVRATIANAKTLGGIEGEFGGFHAYVTSFSDYSALSKDMKRRFSFLGEMSVWYVLFRCGEPVPKFESWVTTIPGEHPRMREMVELARRDGRSRER
jgi:hypothetical protein